ncbi:hypothetical protein HOB94_06170 [bacterium]|nr:hypothetical protein [bacterium]MBT4633490.1 hypothetical protein [bacterium]MBT6779391.1 hypothetical protein [bacterium]
MYSSKKNLKYCKFTYSGAFQLLLINTHSDHNTFATFNVSISLSQYEIFELSKTSKSKSKL